MKIAFSTLACPEWTLEQAADRAASMGYLGVDMRSFLSVQERMANDPMSLEPSEVDRIYDNAGVIPLCLSTGVKFDKPIEPPLLGRIFVNEEAGVSEAKQFVDLADRAGVKFVRVYGCHLPAAEPKTWSTRRVTERLTLAAQTCRNTDVRLLIENAGSFARGGDLLELIERVDSQWLGASYNMLAAVNAGECPVDGVRTLRDHLKIVRISDTDDDGNPVMLGKGRFPIAKLIETLAEIDYDGWIVYEYPKLWEPELGTESEEVLKHACDTLYDWVRSAQAAGV
ncbi:MAG: sugar phosphate isomerase/epimerase family protein [Phycisphaerales bacterium JB052]